MQVDLQPSSDPLPENKDRLLHGLVPPSLMASSDQEDSDPGVKWPGKWLRVWFYGAWGFRGRRIERRHFRLDQFQDGGRRPFWKFQMAISLQRIIRLTLCMYTDHILCLRTLQTVDAYDRRLATYFAREGVRFPVPNAIKRFKTLLFTI